MNKEFHYWITGIIAYKAGFSAEEANIIAYSSQYVDDNNRGKKILDKSTNKVFTHYISQTMDILKPKNKLLRIYPIFHFIPGNPVCAKARRRDGKMHLLNTTPDNETANSLLQAAFQADPASRLYRIGIATHSYADTWGHQNFVGWHDSFNALGLNPIPNIGHADALHNPDLVNFSWQDQRLVEKNINNNHRLLAAAQALFQHYTHYLKTTADWPSLKADLTKLISTPDEQVRIKAYRAYAPWLQSYDEHIWFSEAVAEEKGILQYIPFNVFPSKCAWRDGITKEKTDWYKFQMSVIDHEQGGIKLLKNIFKQIDVNIAVV